MKTTTYGTTLTNVLLKSLSLMPKCVHWSTTHSQVTDYSWRVLVFFLKSISHWGFRSYRHRQVLSNDTTVRLHNSPFRSLCHSLRISYLSGTSHPTTYATKQQSQLLISITPNSKITLLIFDSFSFHLWSIMFGSRVANAVSSFPCPAMHCSNHR
jgi:hypothetical protein